MSSTPPSQLQVLRSSASLKSLLFSAGYSIVFSVVGVLAAFSSGTGRPLAVVVTIGVLILAVGVAFGIVGIIRAVRLIRSGEFVAFARIAIVVVVALPVVALIVRLLVS